MARRSIKPEPSHVRGLCISCQKNLQKPTGAGTFKAICNQCNRKRYETPEAAARRAATHRHGNNVRYRPYRLHLKDRCERCDFVPEDTCQLDVHHRDHDHTNDDPTNLQTLCANCHRLQHKDGPPR